MRTVVLPLFLLTLSVGHLPGADTATVESPLPVAEPAQVGMSAKGADSQAINLGKTLKTGLVAGATALAGAGLVSYLNDSVTAFQEAQVAASQFARATNATVEEAGKFTTVAGALGLEMNDLIEINAEFSKKVQEQPGLLKALNVEVAKNADGSVNMTRTLVATIDALHRGRFIDVRRVGDDLRLDVVLD